MMDMSHLTGTPQLAKDTGKGIGGIFTRLWVKLHVKKVALLEQIREHPNTPPLKDQNDTMAWCITKVAKDLGLNTG